MGYYDDLVEKYGDNDACKRMYKRGKVVLEALKGILLTATISLNGFLHWETYLFIIISLVGVVSTILNIIRKPLNSIHVRPDLDDVDFGDGSLREREDNEEDVFEVKYKKNLIKGEYRNSLYHISIIPKECLFVKKEQTVIHKYPAVTEEELSRVLAQAVEFVAGLSKEANQQG